MRTRVRLTTFKQLISSRCHAEPANGNPNSNRTYCAKSGNYFEYNTIPYSRSCSSTVTNNRDTIATEFADAISNQGHKGIVQFKDSHPGTWYFHGKSLLDNFALAQPPISRPDIKAYWFHGLTGTGKSRLAFDLLPNAYYKESRTKWWHGYLCQSTCIIDELVPKSIDISYLLKWFDRYPCLVETKGSMIPLYVQTFIITSNYTPEEIYPDAEERTIHALKRRLTTQLFPLDSLSQALFLSTNLLSSRFSGQNSERCREQESDGLRPGGEGNPLTAELTVEPDGDANGEGLIHNDEQRNVCLRDD